MISANMSLIIPTVGSTAGPEYATDINISLSLLDAHDHSAGKGVQITPDGLNINAELSLGNNDLIDINSTRFRELDAVLGGGSDLRCLYAVDDDLYYNDGSGNQVRITQSGGVAGSPGSISNLASPASASYVALAEKFVWQSDANVAASMDMRSAILRNSAASSFGLTLSPPSLSSNYSIILPSLPAGVRFVTIDNSGNMGATYNVDNVTLEISSNNIQIKNASITTAKLANDLNLPGTSVLINSRPPVVANDATAFGLRVVRGIITVTWTGSNISGASVNTGVGWTVSSFTSTTVSISFDTVMGDTPAVVVTGQEISGTTNNLVWLNAVNTSGFQIEPQSNSNATINYHFIAIGV